LDCLDRPIRLSDEFGKDLDARLGQFPADQARQRAAHQARHDGEQDVERADVLVVRREEPALEEGRLVVVVVVVVIVSGGGGHRSYPEIVFSAGARGGSRSRGGSFGRSGGRSGGRGGRSGGARSSNGRGSRSRGRGLGGDPGVEVGLADHLDLDRHERVIDAAQLRALAVVGADLLGLEPLLLQAARDGVHLEAEGRQGEGVDHVGAGGLHADHLVDRHHQRGGGGEAEGHALGLGFLFRQQARDLLGDLLVRVLVAPVPLIAGGLHRHVGLGHVVVGEQKLEREDGDAHQDQDGEGRPDDLDRGVVGELRGDRIGLLPEAHDDVDQQAQHEERDERDDRHQDHVVEEDRVVLQRRRRRLQVDRAGSRLTQPVLGVSRPAKNQTRASRGQSRRSPPHPRKLRLHIPHGPFSRRRPASRTAAPGV
jgi:hypothetical protein